MKDTIKYVLALVTLFLTTTGAMAESTITITKSINGDGIGSTNPGNVSSSVTDGTCTLTVTPSDAYYATVDNITVYATVLGDIAESIHRAPVINEGKLEVTALNSSADPSGATSYSFTMPTDDSKIEITVDFQNRIDISNAEITLSATSLTYTGEKLEPAVQSVVLEQGIQLSTNDYAVAYSNNIDAGTATVTITGARTFTGTATANFSITQAEATVTFPESSYTIEINKTFTAPQATVSPQGLTLKYTSSNEEVATVNAETGAVNIVGIGETKITATVENSNYQAATANYTLIVTEEKEYDIIVNDILINKDNRNDVLSDGDADTEKAPSVFYNPDNCTMVLTNAQDLNITCNRTDSLRIYLLQNNTAKQIICNNNQCQLIFTTDGAFPGALKLSNPEGQVVTGFSDTKYEYNLQLTAGALTADSATINVILKPIVKKITQLTPTEDLLKAEIEATKQSVPATVKYIKNNFMYTYSTANNNGPSLSGNAFIINTPTTDDVIKNKLENLDVNSNEYAEDLNGITFRLPPGEYVIEIDADYAGDMELALFVQGTEPHYLEKNVRGLIVKTNELVVVALYAVQRTSNGTRRIGRKDSHSVIIRSLNVTPLKVNSCNAVSSVAGDYPVASLEDESQDPNNDVYITDETEVIEIVDPSAIHNSRYETTITATEYYTPEGRKLTKPQPGVNIRVDYLSNGETVTSKVIKIQY